MKKEHRWLKSVIAASVEPVPAFPWSRTARRKPASLQPAQVNYKALATASR